MASLDKLKPGDVLFDYHRDRSVMRSWSNWEVRVISVDHGKGTAMCSWNGNAPRLYTRTQIARLRRTPGATR